MKGVELNKKYTYAQMCEIFECEQKKGTVVETHNSRSGKQYVKLIDHVRVNM